MLMTEAEYLEHPQARLIPKSLWFSRKVFNCQVADEELAVMTKDLAAIDGLEVNTSSWWSSTRKLRYWICLLVGHSGAATTDLLLAAHRLALPLSIIVKGALLVNRLDILEGVDLASPEIESIIATDGDELFRTAAGNGEIDILNWFKTKVPHKLQSMIAAYTYNAFNRAAENGHLVVLDWFKTEAPGKLQAMIAAYEYTVFPHAAAEGHLTVLNWLKAEAPDQLQAMIATHDYEAFREAAAGGHIGVLNWLKTEAPDQFRAMIAAQYYRAFRLPSEKGDLTVLNWLKAEAPDQLQSMIIGGDSFFGSVDHYTAFRHGAKGGHLSVLNWFKTEAPDKLQAMIAARDYEAFTEAARTGNLTVLNWLKTEAPDKLQAMIAADCWAAFRGAAGNGHIAVLDWLKTEAPDNVQIMIGAVQYSNESSAFCLAADHGQIAVLDWLKREAPAQLQAIISISNRNAAGIGHLAVLNWLKAEAPDQLPAIVAAKEYEAFRNAAATGNFAVLNWLKAEAPDQLQAMIAAKDNEAFRRAGGNGFHEVLSWLKREASEQLPTMVAAKDYEAFRYSVTFRYHAVLDWFKTETPAQLQAMIAAKEYGAITEAAEVGDIDVLNWLKIEARDKLPAMVSAQNFHAFRIAASAGNLDVLNWFITEAPADQLQAMIAAKNYEAFRNAAFSGQMSVLDFFKSIGLGQLQAMTAAHEFHAFREAAGAGRLEVLNWLKTEVPGQWEAMIAARNFRAFRDAVDYRRPHVAQYLLSFSLCFAYAEMHESEYSRLTHPYIATKFDTLRRQRLAFETANPQAIFNLTDVNDSKTYFYILRNLIRRNDPSVLDDIRFLLEIPAVKGLAHIDITTGQPNELIRLALTVGNRAAAEILLNIPDVRELAERNNFYRAELRGGLDLAALAQDRESSMRSLTTGEEVRLSAAIERYQPTIRATGIEPLFSQLRAELVARYERQPAMININGVATALPAKWADFSHLSLNAAQRQEALKAYYQHKDHSALRYISRPNPWLAPNASYVEPARQCSSFEEYKSLIVMYWLAAKDTVVPPTDGHTLEGRITHFYDELAHIGRAHNWDRTRLRADGHGHEDYDDLEGDKPSCYSGVKRRLFQSVIGHPLLKMLTAEDIKQELRDFVRSHFIRLINEGNRVPLMNAWDNYCVSLDLADAAPLRALDINTEQQTQFVLQLKAKYGAHWSENTTFKPFIEMSFALINNPGVPSDCMHALKFAGLVNLEQILRSPIVAAPEVGASTIIGTPPIATTLGDGGAAGAGAQTTGSSVGFFGESTVNIVLRVENASVPAEGWGSCCSLQ